jgi:hypothetical protein
VFGVRTGSPMQATSAPDGDGGVMPGATSAIGQQNLATGQSTGLENPSPSGHTPKQPMPGLEARQPTKSPTAAPDTAN